MVNYSIGESLNESNVLRWNAILQTLSTETTFVSIV